MIYEQMIGVYALSNTMPNFLLFRDKSEPANEIPRLDIVRRDLGYQEPNKTIKHNFLLWIERLCPIACLDSLRARPWIRQVVGHQWKIRGL